MKIPSNSGNSNECRNRFGSKNTRSHGMDEGKKRSGAQVLEAEKEWMDGPSPSPSSCTCTCTEAVGQESSGPFRDAPLIGGIAELEPGHRFRAMARAWLSLANQGLLRGRCFLPPRRPGGLSVVAEAWQRLPPLPAQLWSGCTYIHGTCCGRAPKSGRRNEPPSSGTCKRSRTPNVPRLPLPDRATAEAFNQPRSS